MLSGRAVLLRVALSSRSSCAYHSWSCARSSTERASPRVARSCSCCPAVLVLMVSRPLRSRGLPENVSLPFPIVQFDGLRRKANARSPFCPFSHVYSRQTLLTQKPVQL